MERTNGSSFSPPTSKQKSSQDFACQTPGKKSSFITWLKHYYSQQQISCREDGIFLGNLQQSCCHRHWFFVCLHSESFVRRLSQPAALLLPRSRNNKEQFIFNAHPYLAIYISYFVAALHTQCRGKKKKRREPERKRNLFCIIIFVVPK